MGDNIACRESPNRLLRSDKIVPCALQKNKSEGGWERQNTYIIDTGHTFYYCTFRLPVPNYCISYMES